MLFAHIKNLNDTIVNLKVEINDLKTELNKSQFEKFITSDKKCLFYTNIDKTAFFDLLPEKIGPLSRRRSDTTGTREQFKFTPKMFGPETKLSSKDKFFLTLMKLRLGLLTADLAHRFGTSGGPYTQIFYSWIRGMSEHLKSFIYMPDIEKVLVISPKRYKSFSNLIGIIDCSEIFIETPKSLELQSATWSDYKHHNTMKFLVCVAPNSAITFISKAYTGRISDKAITLKPGFLHIISRYSSIMADKGFNIVDDCAARCIHFIVPPGRRDATQMTPANVKKTYSMAKVRILVEQA